MAVLSVYSFAPDDQMAEAASGWLGGTEIKDEQVEEEPYKSAEIPSDPAESFVPLEQGRTSPGQFIRSASNSALKEAIRGLF